MLKFNASQFCICSFETNKLEEIFYFHYLLKNSELGADLTSNLPFNDFLEEE